MRITIQLAFLLLALTGCQFSPPATTKPVTTNDVVGVWSFTEEYGKTTVFMSFMPSGVFTQQVVTAASTNTQVGNWSLNDSWLNLTDFLADESGSWNITSMSWYFIDGDQRLVIYGGAVPDPDSYQELKYIRAAP